MKPKAGLQEGLKDLEERNTEDVADTTRKLKEKILTEVNEK